VRRTGSLLTADTLLQSISVAMVLAIASRLFGFGRGVLFARVLDPVELGTWALMANAVQVLAFVLVFGVPSAMSRYVERCHRDGRLLAIVVQSSAATLVLAAVVCIAGVFCADELGAWLFGEAASRTLVTVTLVSVFMMAAFSVAKGVMHGLRLFRLDSWMELAHNVGCFFLVGAFFLAWPIDATVGGWTFVVITFLTTAMAGLLLWRVLRGTSVTAAAGERTAVADSWRLIATYSLATWSAGSLQALWTYLDRYMLLHLSGLPNESVLEQIGGYYIASRLGQPLTVVAGLLSVILLPHAARLWETDRREEVCTMLRLTLKLSAAALTLAGAALIVLKQEAMALLIGRVPHSASITLAPVLITIIAVALHYVLRSYLLCRERVWIATGLWTAALTANGLLNLWLIPRYQLYGAALATLISSMGAALASAWLAARDGLRLDVGSWLACALPLALLLPPQAMLAVLAAVAGSVLFSQWFLSDVERDLLNSQFPGRSAQGPRPRRITA
jgi:O-antigen/teichoic acid export membrane protein